MNDEFNPLRREYSEAEIAAGIRVGEARREKKFAPYPEVITVVSGPMIWATHDIAVQDARKMANDWKLVADAMEREWARPKPWDTEGKK